MIVRWSHVSLLHVSSASSASHDHDTINRHRGWRATIIEEKLYGSNVRLQFHDGNAYDGCAPWEKPGGEYNLPLAECYVDDDDTQEQTSSSVEQVITIHPARQAVPDVSSPGSNYPTTDAWSRSESSKARSTELQATGHDLKQLDHC